MGRYVEIKKIKTLNGSHYYQARSNDYPKIGTFFIKLNPEKKEVCYSQSKNFLHTSCFNIDQKSLEIEWLPNFLIFSTLKKAKEALSDNQFPQFISFQS